MASKSMNRYYFSEFRDLLNMTNALILVPSRYGSTRFPGKPLAMINGKPMIAHIVQNCQETGFEFAIVTDDERIEEAVKIAGGKSVRVDEDVSTGSERIALALDKYYKDQNFDYIVNMQGDEPLMRAQYIKKVVESHAQSDFDIFTAVKPRSGEESSYLNPNIVKAVLSQETKACLYFSRAGVPYYQTGEVKDWSQHIGIYSYRPEALLKFSKLKPSQLEICERLEQLRALENGLTIGATKLEVELLGVDTPEDIKKVEGVMGE